MNKENIDNININQPFLQKNTARLNDNHLKYF